MAPIKEQAIDKYPYIQYMGRFDGMSESYSGTTNKRYSSKHGFVKYLSVDGASVKWNQIKQNSTFENTATYTGSGCSISASDNVLTATADADSTPAILFTVNLKASGKYYLGVDIKPSELMSAAVFNGTNIRLTDIASGVWTRLEGIYSPAEDLSASMYLYFNYGGANNGKSTQFRNLCIYDLTAIFGAGNEPTTVDAFKATKEYKAAAAGGYLYDYDAGSLISIENVTVGGTTIETDLLSVGSAHDELILNYDEWTVNRNIGERSYQEGDESDPDVLTDGTTTYYELATPTQDEPESINPIEISSSFEVKTEVDTTFEMVSGAV